MSIDPADREWLQGDALQAAASNAAIAARFPALATESGLTSPIASAGDASAEAARQIDFMGGPLVQDVALVAGARSDLIGSPITVVNSRLGYAAGVVCWVLGAEELDDMDMTQLTILRRLS